MLFSKRLSLQSLIELCRTLRHNLGAGLTLRDVFRQLSKRGSLSVRPVAERICEQVERGDSIEEALNAEQAYFPPMFLALAKVGERSGNLPEVFGEMEKYYLLQQRLKRQFISQITLPVLQFFAAVFVIALMLYVLGAIAESNRTTAMDPIGLGTGAAGALTFLGMVFGTLTALAVVYFVATRTLNRRTMVDELLLKLPVVGPCLMAFALARFCLALRLTHETGMPITSALRLCLRATDNSAFEARTEVVLTTLRGGDELAVALANCHLFPEEFQNIVAVAEESGRLPEVMGQQADYYEEEASRRLTVLTRVAGYGVYATYAVLVIIAIFMIARNYFGPLNEALKG
jgi:type IV pilus assembly protein PilC